LVLSDPCSRISPEISETGEILEQGSLKTKPGLYVKLPWPIQNVYKYPKKLQLLEDQLEEAQTADGHAVILQMYVAWSIDDPYAFFRSVKDIEPAEDELRPLMRGLRGVVSSYAFDELVNTDPQQLKLNELEQRSAEALREQLAKNPAGYGIAIRDVGIRRLVLPEQTTAKVFDRMRATRERMAANARAEGESTAATIRAEAQSAQRRILAFANRRATEIENIGLEEAAQLIEVFNRNPELAMFLARIDALRETLGNKTTFILSAEDIGLKELLNLGREQTGAPTAPAQ
jgi:membrane protease subunit HflC